MAMIYCLTVGVAIYASADPGFRIYHEIPGARGVISVYVPEFYHHLERPDHLVLFELLNQKQSLNKLFGDYVKVIQSHQQKLIFCFLQHRRFLQNVRIKYRKADGIFPFHYFW